MNHSLTLAEFRALMRSGKLPRGRYSLDKKLNIMIQERSDGRADKQPKRRPAPPKAKGPGDHLHEIIAERIGVLPADQGATCRCKEMIRSMNGWGVEGCMARRTEIVAHLAGQANQLPATKRWALKLPGGKWLARHVAEQMFETAMQRTEMLDN